MGDVIHIGHLIVRKTTPACVISYMRPVSDESFAADFNIIIVLDSTGKNTCFRLQGLLGEGPVVAKRIAAGTFHFFKPNNETDRNVLRGKIHSFCKKGKDARVRLNW